jgi:ectoine hydroxylase-related dioxygenase (phytanoyl-CoA dioxygenase family)
MSSAPDRPTPASRRRPYHLDDEQVAAFDRDGYLVLRQRVVGDLLASLQERSAAWIERGQALDPRVDDTTDHQFAERAGGARLWRIDYLHALGDPASLVLLGSPEILGIAESLAGPDLVPTYESLVFKAPGDGAPVRWHQDAVHPRRHRIFNVDVYLDASRRDAGALRVLRGSQRSPVDVCAVAEDHGWEPPEVVEVELDPGDVLVHDVMVVHGSPETSGTAPLRRTIYAEFRPAAQILEEGPWDRDWVDARLRLLPVALSTHAAHRPDAPGFEWQPSEALRPRPMGDDDTELRVAHGAHSPGSWCSPSGVLTS